MVIAIDIRLLGKKRTGDETVFRYLTRELVKIEQEARLLLLTDETDPTKLKSLGKELGVEGKKNVEIISLPARNRYSWNVLAIPKFLCARKVDILHTQYIMPFFVPKQTKLFAHIHDVSFKAFPELIGWKDRLFLALLIPRTMRIADRIIAVSEFTKQEIIDRYHVAKERIAVIPNATGDEFESEATEEEIRSVRERYGLPEKFILSIGTMQPRKNIPLLIRAFAETNKKAPELKLILAGKRYGYRYDTEIDRAIAETDTAEKVIFPGYIEAKDLPALYAAAHVFAFPSLYEGFGIPLLEAFSQNTPVASSDIPPSREVSGEAALFFDPSSIASAAEILYNVTIDENLRSRLSERGKDRWVFFSWKKSAALLQNLFRERHNH